MKNNFTDYDSNMCLTVDSLIDMKNIITGFNNIILRMLMLNHLDVIECIWTKA